MIKVDFCEESAITEAWAVITGAPGPVDRQEAEVVSYIVKKTLKELQPQPSLVIVEQRDLQNVPPFWQNQYSWENNKYLARLGHRYLSVHYVKQGEDKYTRYEHTLEPAIQMWLKAYDETLRGTPKPYALDRVGFGYINTFQFPQADFDLSRYVKLDFGVGSETARHGLSALEINFELLYPETNTIVGVNLLVRPIPPTTEQLQFRTVIEAKTPLNEAHTFLDQDKLLNLIKTTKDMAKNVFFDLATNETHQIMKACYAANAT